MADNIRTLYTLPDNLYVTGSPVLIAGGTLSLEQQTGAIFAQLALRNIDVKPVSAVTLSITPLDPANRPIREPLSYSLLDLNVPRDGIFGQETPLTMPDFNTRAITVAIREVIFTDHTFWTAPAETWAMLPKPKLLAEAYGDEELCKQFRLRFGENSIFLPDAFGDLWRCTCGGINRAREEHCHRCTRQLGLMRSAGVSELTAEKNARLAAEQAERDRIEAERRAAAEARIAAEAERKAEEERQKAERKAEEERQKAAKAQQKAAEAEQKRAEREAAKAEAEAILPEPEPVKEAPKEEPEKKHSSGSKVKKLLFPLALLLVAAGVVFLIKDSLNSQMPADPDQTEAPVQVEVQATPEELYAQAEQLEQDGKIAEAAITFGKAGDYEDARERSLALWDGVAERKTIAQGESFALAVRSDGTVLTSGRDYETAAVADCTDVIAVAACGFRAVVLRADGTAVSAGSENYNQTGISRWTDLVSVAAGWNHTVGLRMDGTIIAAGDNSCGQCDVSGWANIIAVDAGEFHTVGLRADGTVVAVGDNSWGQCDVSDWTDIVAVSAYCSGTVGLRSDGTVVAVGDNSDGQCNVSGWSDIVAISSGLTHTVGLRADGTVVAAGYTGKFHRIEVSQWTNIVEIAAGDWCTFGLRADGAIITDGGDGFYMESEAINHWTNVKLPNR